MIGVEFLKGQGLGNRLLCYVSARALAERLGVPFGTAGREYLQADFLDLDLGEEITDLSGFSRYEEADRRLFTESCAHDMVHGCFVADADPAFFEQQDGTLLYGNLQAEAYFENVRDKLDSWFSLKPEYRTDAYTADDLCVINFRGGEYAGEPALYLRQEYWRKAMFFMHRENPRMRFVTVTDDPAEAERMLPGIPALHHSTAEDFAAVQSAKYLILSNSSFAVLPALTNPQVKKIIAPKYWARHNVSDGYWSSPQNIYSGFLYMDRRGRLQTAEECRAELESYEIRQGRQYADDNPKVLAMKKKQERKRLLGKARRKIMRLFRIRSGTDRRRMP